METVLQWREESKGDILSRFEVTRWPQQDASQQSCEQYQHQYYLAVVPHVKSSPPAVRKTPLSRAPNR